MRVDGQKTQSMIWLEVMKRSAIPPTKKVDSLTREITFIEFVLLEELMGEALTAVLSVVTFFSGLFRFDSYSFG